MPSLQQRVLVPEMMDADDVSIDMLRRSLRFIRMINTLFGGTSALIKHFKTWSHDWGDTTREPITVLDIATGSADIPLAFSKWAVRHGHDVRITAIDRHPRTLGLASEYLEQAKASRDSITREAASRIQLMRTDALQLPFDPDSFDYCTTSMFLHHLEQPAIIAVLSAMGSIARQGVVWNDLLRERLGYHGSQLLVTGRHEIVRHDAPTSVLAGFRRPEIIALGDAAGLTRCNYHRHLFSRFTLAGPV